jgi:hypothetical protein
VRDIVLPEGVTTRVTPDLTAISVMAPTVEETPAAGAVATAPEVITAKKEDTGDAAAGKDAKK